MQKIYLFLLTLIAALQFQTTTFAQADLLTEDTVGAASPSYFKFGIDYISDNVYLGRKDSSRIPYLTPTIGYYHRSGLFAEASLSFIPKSNSQIDVYTIDGGYDFHDKNYKFTGELFAAKYFFNTSSNSVRSEISGETDASVAYDFGFIKVNGGMNVLFSNPVDLMFNAGLSHAFDFGKNYEWSVTPTASTNIGSLNFYKEYYTKRKLKKRFGTRRSITVSGKNDFSVLDYEFSLPLAYDTKKWSFLVSPYYVIPENPVRYSVNGIFIKQETLDNSFFLEASAAFKF